MSQVLLAPLSIAPMIDWTNSPFRMLMRLLAPQALLYTEMHTAGAIRHNPERALYYNAQEHPLALQLGGADPAALAVAAKQAEQAGFDEINLNLGCPSDKVLAGQFGACMMKQPHRVAECIETLRQAVSIPVTAKTRIGIDHEDSYAFFNSFAKTLIDAGCQKLIVHARKAWLHGLSPKQNRSIPPVNYDYVYQFKAENPQLPVVINGNINDIAAIGKHLEQVDGVMLGRLACDNPYKIAQIHAYLYPDYPLTSRNEVCAQYLLYAQEVCVRGLPMSLLLKPLFNLAYGLAGAGLWKQQLMAAMQSKDGRRLQQLTTYLPQEPSLLPA